ncbi:Transcriptional regulator, GntR family [hydrothermal vent metagenome]|uniref:Transcriptional regulator, GntR family n=1 Tax=hydrothermal vent metagenome TaxID=652676 RepID=A0A3B0T0B0_9ZZZZ
MKNETRPRSAITTPPAESTSRRKRAPNAPPIGAARFADQSVKSIADAIHQRLRQDIVSLALVPGLPISEQDLALAEGVSRTPVREAILRLAKERLVEVVPKSGTFVARIPLSALPEAIVVRRALEGVTVRAAANAATAEQIAEIQSLLEHQARVCEAGDLAAFHLADEAFHAAIARIGRYPGIWDLVQQVKVHVDRYRRLTLPIEGRMATVIEEHRAVLEAMKAGDADLAVARMEDHLGKLQLEISVIRDMWPDYFVHDIQLDEVLPRPQP